MNEDRLTGAQHVPRKSGWGVRLIAEERVRQVAEEGFTPEHDDEHADGELLEAAFYYLREALHGPGRDGHGGRWPWEDESWKPSMHPEVNLVKAGALIAAEIDRLKRASES